VYVLVVVVVGRSLHDNNNSDILVDAAASTELEVDRKVAYLVEAVHEFHRMILDVKEASAISFHRSSPRVR